MPTYAYVCLNDHEFDRYLPVSEFDTPQVCECGAPSRKVITLPMIMVAPDVHYDSPIDGRPITSMAARREDLARSNCVPYDPDLKYDQLRRTARQEEELEKAVEETVEREIDAMPTIKRERLQRELDEGVTAEPLRTTAPAKPIHTEIEK